MSSHHIVREKQEPALFIQSLAGFDHEHLGQLLEWNPVVIVNEQEHERVHTIGIKVDVVVSAQILQLQENVLLLPVNGGELGTVMKYLVTTGHTAVNVVTDHFDLSGSWFFADKINLVTFCGHRKIYPVKNGFAKWLASGEELQLHQDMLLLTFENLEKLSDNRYRVIHDGFVRLGFAEPMLFISETLY